MTLLRFVRAGLLLVLSFTPWFGARADEARTALVIGNSRYTQLIPRGVSLWISAGMFKKIIYKRNP